MVIPVAAIIAGAEIASNIANVIQVGIMVNDSLTPTLDTYEGRISNLDDATDAWLNMFTRSVPTTFLDTIRTGIDYIRNGLLEAATIQTSIIASSSDLSQNLKIPIDDARHLIEDSQVAIAKIAAALPGETAGYADIYRSISGTLSKQFSGEEFKKQSEEFTKRIGLLASIRGADAPTAGNASNRFLAGTMGFGEAIVQDIFQRNPALYSALLEQLNVMKVDPEDWKKVQQSVRTKIFSAALAKAAPDALIAEFEGTFQGTIETLKTEVFDPISGLFGLLRKIDSQGQRTVLDAANGVLQSLNGLKDSMVKIAKTLGINLDPMYYLIQVFDTINDIVGKLHLAVLSVDPVASFTKWVESIPEMLGTWIVSSIKFVSGLLDRLLSSGLDGEKIGNIAGTVTNLFETIKDKVLDNIDVMQLAELYFKVSKEIADMQGEMWWASIKIMPTRIGNWFSELWVNLVIGFQPIRVVCQRFVELMERILTPLNDAMEALSNPLGFAARSATGTVLADSNKPGSSLQPGNIITDIGKTGFNLGKQVTDGVFNLFTPKPAAKKAAFAPSVTIHANTNATADDIAAMVQDKMSEAYSAYQNEVLS